MRYEIKTLLLALSACGGGTGTLSFTTYGEDFIEQEIPAARSAGDEGLVDGFTVRYEKFLVNLSNLEVRNQKGAVGAELAEQRIYDVHEAGPHPVHTFFELGADTWPDVGITVKPAQGAVRGNATESDVTLMNQNGYSVYAEGYAEKGPERFDFRWGFTTHTRYSDCVDAEEAAGVIVADGGSETAQFTVHGDHLFYDDLQSEEPSLRFAAFAAADADADKTVSLEELAAVDLTTLPADQYGTGGDAAVQNLGQFVAALTRTLVHFQGEGHCEQHKE